MDEKQIAHMEAAQNEWSDSYFTARPKHDSRRNRQYFAAGFERGYATKIPVDKKPEKSAAIKKNLGGVDIDAAHNQQKEPT